MSPTSPPPIRRIAVLDDDLPFIRMIERVLAGEYEVCPVTTPDLDEAVRVIVAHGCEAALVDVFMYGDPAGFAVIDKLRSNPTTASLPIIVTTGAHREVGRKVGVLREQDCAVLLKPFESADLRQKLREISEAHAQTTRIVPSPAVAPAIVQNINGLSVA